MVQISCNPADLNGAQRKAVADFVLNFPGACVGSCGGDALSKALADAVTSGTGMVKMEHVPLAEIHDAGVNELEALQHDHESTMPEAAFGKPDTGALEAAAAFGGAPVAVPLVPSTPPAVASTVAQSAPAPTAPTTTTPGPVSLAAGAAPAGVELDKHGLPWDNRIHAESKAKIADGTWRKKRGVDPALVAQVEAELRQVMGAPSSPLVASTVPSAPTPPLATAAPLAFPVAAVVPQPPADVKPSIATLVSLPSGTPGDVPQDPRAQFVALIGRASAAIQAGKVTQEEINQACQAVGVPALPLLANRLDLVATVAASIDTIIASRGQ